MMGCSSRKIEYDPNTNYYEVCAECLARCMELTEAGREDELPEICQGCPFE